ncbi:hypothetical protein [Nocardia cyriacigeorgica]|uniref:hypothetical protein n=1 Tax=Nocardia cyriacigeorgica TaxID=135487 RepID=UPI003CC7F71A
MSTRDTLDNRLDLRVLPPVEWRARARAHRERIDELIGPYLRRRAEGATHPVIDFLFTYYGHKPAQLRRWHPGFGVGLAGAAEYDGARGYHQVSVDGAAVVATADPAFLAKRRDTVAVEARQLRRAGGKVRSHRLGSGIAG